jgi:drug/metabolite transporter (DMT)-like permease
VAGYLFWYEAIRRIGPARIAVYSYLMPPFGVLVAVLLLRDAFGLQHVIGGIIAIAGVILARWPQPSRSLAGPKPGQEREHAESGDDGA